MFSLGKSENMILELLFEVIFSYAVFEILWVIRSFWYCVANSQFPTLGTKTISLSFISLSSFLLTKEYMRLNGRAHLDWRITLILPQ